MKKPIWAVCLTMLMLITIAATACAGSLSVPMQRPSPTELDDLLGEYYTLAYLAHQRENGGKGPVTPPGIKSYESFDAFQAQFPDDLPTLAANCGKTPTEYLSSLVIRVRAGTASPPYAPPGPGA